MKMRMVWLLTVVAFIAAGAKIYELSVSFDGLERSLLAYGEAVALLRMGSDDLTKKARLFVETGDVAYMDGYFRQANVLKIRDQALDCIDGVPDDQGARKRLSNALGQSFELMKIECHAMKLAALAHGTSTNLVASSVMAYPLEPGEEELPAKGAGSKREKAIRMLYDNEYSGYKDRICGAADCFLVDTLASLRTKRESLHKSYTIWLFGQFAVFLVAIAVSCPYVFGAGGSSAEREEK